MSLTDRLDAGFESVARALKLIYAVAESGLNGPSSSTNNTLARWDGTNGRLLKDGLPVGVSSATDVLDRQSGDSRYRPIGNVPMSEVAGLGDALLGKQNALGFTPLNRAGDAMTGRLGLGGFLERRGTYTSGACDVSSGSVFDAEVSSAVTISLTGLPSIPAAGDTATGLLRLTVVGSPVITWPAGTMWAGGAEPVATDSRLIVTLTAWWTGSAWAYDAAGTVYS